LDNTFLFRLELHCSVLIFGLEFYMMCNTATNVMEESLKSLKGIAKLAQVDTDTERRLTHKFGINRIPAIITYHNGYIVLWIS
jgi:thioredoxin-like negative regulator of GroEL